MKEETTMHPRGEPFAGVGVERERKKQGILYHVITYLKPRNRAQGNLSVNPFYTSVTF